MPPELFIELKRELLTLVLATILALIYLSVVAVLIIKHFYRKKKSKGA